MSEVAIFAPKYPPDVGGAAVYFEQVVRQLRGTEWTPTVFAPRRDDCPVKATMPGGGTLYRCFPHGLVHGAAFVPRCVRLLHSRDFSCVHVHPHFPQWRFYRWVVKALDIPRVYDCRDRTFNRSFVTDGDAFLSAADHIDAELRGYGIDRRRILRSPVVVEIPDRLPPVEFEGDGRNIVFVGDLTDGKGIREAIRGVLMHRRRETADTQLHVYGDGPQRKMVSEQEQRHEWLTYHGAVEHDTALGAIRAADVLLLPSATEGRPRVVLEARKLGTPVVATRAGSIPDIVDGESVLVGKSAESVATGIKNCVGSGGCRVNGGCGVTVDDVGDAIAAVYAAIGD